MRGFRLTCLTGVRDAPSVVLSSLSLRLGGRRLASCRIVELVCSCGGLSG